MTKPWGAVFDKRIPRFVYSFTSRFDGSWTEIRQFLDRQPGQFETLELVRRERLSLARFGDGELRLAVEPTSRVVYQHGSPELQADLRALLRGEGYEGVPVLPGLPGLNSRYYRQYWAKYWPQIRPLLNPALTYGDTSVSRESMFRRDAEAARLAWRRVWQDEDVCYVTGRGSRFEAMPQLFDNVASERFVYSAPRGAYVELPALRREIETTIPRETLILLSLGPAATILAAQLARSGYWAIDLGHIASAYRTVVQGAPRAELTAVVTPETS